uniref:Uncharacterized protein n=1 Tax=Aegilops tauschii subsp. strangulata TaxID=200361 RepID=A0A453DVE2_AEGTS
MEFLWHTLILVIRIKHRWKTMDLIMDELEDTRISNPCIHQSHSYPGQAHAIICCGRFRKRPRAQSSFAKMEDTRLTHGA